MSYESVFAKVKIKRVVLRANIPNRPEYIGISVIFDESATSLATDTKHTLAILPVYHELRYNSIKEQDNYGALTSFERSYAYQIDTNNSYIANNRCIYFEKNRQYRRRTIQQQYFNLC
jgi:hypothetical protein